MAEYLVNRHPLQRMSSPSRGVSALVHVSTENISRASSQVKIQGPELMDLFSVGRTRQLRVVIQIVWLLCLAVLAAIF